MEDIPNTTAHLRDRFAELQAAYTGGVQLHLAAENMLDNLFEERLGKNDLLPLGENGDHLLVETFLFQSSDGLEKISCFASNLKDTTLFSPIRSVMLYG